MLSRVKKGPKAILGLILIAALYFGAIYAYRHGWIPGVKHHESIVPQAVNLPTADVLAKPTAANVPLLPFPSTQPANVPGPKIQWYQMAWQSQTAANYANGGPSTTKGSLMEKHGVNLQINRKDDCGQMQNLLVAAATRMKEGDANAGAILVAIMGDGAAAFFAGVNPMLAKIGPEYIAQGFYSCGYSRGEDKFMGPQEWKDNPQAARGGVIAGYLRDGDWNIAIEWATQNGIPNNPDPTTYCPDALNWMATDDFLLAAVAYNTNAHEERPVVDLKGRRTGKKVDVKVNAVVTWTPGDVNIAEGRGGLVSIVSTYEYRWQMPNLVIGIKKWLESNPKTVQNFIIASNEAGDQVKAHREVLKRATDVNKVIWNEEKYPGYWLKYFSRVTVVDTQGLNVECGGSAVNNLADNLQLFGLLEGHGDLYKQVYTEFGNLVVQQYPDIVPSYPPYEEVVNKSFLMAVRDMNTGQMIAPDMPTFTAEAPIEQVVSTKDWKIEFAPNSDQFDSQAYRTLEQLDSYLRITGLRIEVAGHTDADGDGGMNQALSERRAQAVKQWLQTQSPRDYPDSRFNVRGHGESRPVASNDSPQGKARNRRVAITVGS